MSLVYLFSLLLLAVLGLSSCQQAAGPSAENDSAKEEKEPEATLRLPIKPVSTENVSKTLALPGFVLALPDHSVKVSPGIAGKLIDVKVASGAEVKKGQVIALLDNRQLANQVSQARFKVLVALAGVKQAKTGLLLSENTADRNAQLVQQDVGAEKDLVAAKSQVETSRAQVLAAEAQVEDAQAAEAAAKAQLTYTIVRSPITGLVAQRYLNISDSADTTTPILQIVDLNPVIIDASLPTTQPADVVKGQKAIITAKALPGLKMAGTVQGINAVTDNQGTTVGIRILCANPKHDLREGMPVVATIVTGVHPHAITVPVSAVVSDQTDPEKKMVYVYKDGKIHRVSVSVGIQTGERFEILTGLHESESIVTSGAYGIPDGTEVEAQSEPLHSVSKVTSKSD